MRALDAAALTPELANLVMASLLPWAAVVVVRRAGYEEPLTLVRHRATEAGAEVVADNLRRYYREHEPDGSEVEAFICRKT